MPALDSSDTNDTSHTAAPRRLHLAQSVLSFVFLVAVLAGCVLAGCRGGDTSSDSTPTIDVEPALEVPTENDPKEVPRKSSGLSGVLPGGFPSDVPLFLPASLVDYGEQDGMHYVELVAATQRAKAEQGLRGLLVDRGWTVVEELADGTPGSLRLSKDERRIRVVFLDKGPGAHYRILY